VEDDKVNIDLGLLLLEKLGHRVMSAENGALCLEALGKDEFDIVLMDIQREHKKVGGVLKTRINSFELTAF